MQAQRPPRCRWVINGHFAFGTDIAGLQTFKRWDAVLMATADLMALYA